MSAPQKLPIIKFHCETCSQKLSVAMGQEGRKYSCPSCSSKNHVPRTAIIELQDDGASIIKFCCAACDQSLSVPTGLEGRKFHCPNCTAENHVPGAAPTDLWVNEQSVIKFFCEHCGEKLSCDEGEATKEKKCPKCRELTSVPVRALNGTGVSASLLRGAGGPGDREGIGPDLEEAEAFLEAAGETASPLDDDLEIAAPSGGVGEDHDDTPINGHGGTVPSGRASTSQEDLFESLKELGFEVKTAASPQQERGSDPGDTD